LITVNGNKMEWRPGLTIEQVLKNLSDIFPIIVVKVNGKPVSKKEFKTFEIPNNADIATIEIIAGG